MKNLKNHFNLKTLGLVTTMMALSGVTVFAETGGTGVSEIIETTATSLKSDANVVIASALGIGVVFFAAKTLWRNFKSLSK